MKKLHTLFITLCIHASLNGMHSSMNPFTQQKALTLHDCIFHWDLTYARELIDNKSNLTARDDDGLTPLHRAVEADRMELCKLLIGSHNGVLEARNREGETPLHSACLHYRPEIVSLLIWEGADTFALTHRRQTPLMFAAMGGNRYACRALLKLVCLKRLFNYTSVIEARDVSGNTALHYAASMGHVKTCELLLDMKSNINAVNNQKNMPVHFAAWNGHTQVVNLLLERGALYDEKNVFDETPIIFAIYGNRLDIEILLLFKGAQTSHPGFRGFQPVHCAVYTGHIPLISHLLKGGADINACNDFNKTPLHVALEENKLPCIKYLLAVGANMFAPNLNHARPIVLAIESGNIDHIFAFLTVAQSIPPVAMTALLIQRFHKNSLLGAIDKNVFRQYVLRHLIPECVKWQLAHVDDLLKIEYNFMHRASSRKLCPDLKLTPYEFAVKTHKSAEMITLLDPSNTAQLTAEISKNMRHLLKITTRQNQ